MGRVRTCVESDVPRIAELYRRVWTSAADRPLAYSEAYFAEMLFRNACHDDDLPSLVYEDDGGEVVGCLGVMPRRMSIRGRPVRMAISHNFMVAPGSRSSLAGVQLMRAFFAGAQDLSIAESNDTSRRVWEGLGGSTAPIYEMVWTRPLRPGRYLASFIGHHRRGHREPFWLRPVTGIMDAVAEGISANPFRPPAPAAPRRALTASSFVRVFADLADGRARRPACHGQWLRSIFELLESTPKRSPFR